MKYDISKGIAPMMPNLKKGLEVLKLITSQVSPDMRQAVVPTLFPSLAAHVSNTYFQYSSNAYVELCGTMSHLCGVTGIGKGQMDLCVKAICRDLVEHDQKELAKVAAQKQDDQTKGKKKGKKAEEDNPHTSICLFYPPCDVTNPAFKLNAKACEDAGNRSQYYKLPEIEMADSMCGGHKKVSQNLRSIFDVEQAGALRATIDGVTCNPVLRVCINFASTPIAARKFYRYELFNGTLGRINFSYKPREGRSGKIPRLGSFDGDFLQQLDVYLDRLKECQGQYKVPQLNKLADQLADEMAKLADLTDDDNLWDIAKRSIVYAWKCGCLLWIMNDMTWTRAIGEMVEWLVYHDLWSKMQLFGDMLKEGEDAASVDEKNTPQNMLDLVPDSFSEAQLEAVRQGMGKSANAKDQLRQWVHRKFIEYSAQTGLYTKTQDYYNRNRK